MRSKKDIEIAHQYLRELKRQFENGDISAEILNSYVHQELEKNELEIDFEKLILKLLNKK